MKKIISLLLLSCMISTSFALKTSKTVRYRRADTGRFTTKDYNTKNPSTTIKETRKRK